MSTHEPAVTYTPGGATHPYTVDGLRMTAQEAIAYLVQRRDYTARDAQDTVALARVDACNTAEPVVEYVGEDRYRIDTEVLPEELATALLTEEYRRTAAEAERLLAEARDRGRT